MKKIVVPERLKGRTFDLAIILGSGLGDFASNLDDPIQISYSDVQGFPAVQVAGHKGQIVAGSFEGRSLLCFQGRFHLYEGYPMEDVTCLVRFAAALDAPRLLLTNAAGGIASHFRAGDFMWIDDHLNLTGTNPLQGLTPAQFLDVSRLYDRTLYPKVKKEMEALDIRLHHGVLCGLVGPSYETPAEIRMLERLGADAVSMSTVNEAIMAHALGVKVVGLSLIANPAAGLQQEALDHAEVLSVADKASSSFLSLMKSLVSQL